jgi:hypothetical protein
MTKYGPKGDLSPSLGDPCPLCHRGFRIGDYTTLLRSKREGRYANDAVEVHWDCATAKQPALARS